MSGLLVRFYHDARGGIAIEYALAVIGVAVAIAEAIRSTGFNLSDILDTVTAPLR